MPDRLLIRRTRYDRRERATARWRARRGGLSCAVAVALLALCALPANAVGAEQKLLAADGAAGAQLGWSVAIDGDTAVVGTFRRDDGRGAAYVYARDNC